MAKIMFIHHSGLVGGAGVSLINVIKSVALNHQVIVYVPSEPCDMIELLELCKKEYGIEVETYGRRIGAITYYSGGDNLKSGRFWYRLSLILKQWRYWNKLIKKCDPDVVIVNSKILCWFGLLREVQKRSSVCFVRETMQGSRSDLANKGIKKMLLKFKKVVFLSEFDANCEGLGEEQTKIIHNYVEETQFDIRLSREEASKRLGVKTDTFHVLYVGGVSYMKGFDLIARAVLECGSNVELVVAGNDFTEALSSKSKKTIKYVKVWEEFVEKKDTFKQIHMVGKQKDMSACYASCDVLVFPMRDAHQARPVFEAGYFSKPVIITNFENIVEFVKDGVNGYLVPENSVEGIREKLELLIKNEPIRKSLGEQNKNNTKNLHNKSKSMNRINEMIEEIREL